MGRKDQIDKQSIDPYHIRLPSFINDEEIGLGDAIGRVTTKFGIKPCGACQHRASTLNSWVVFSRK